jgi:hypothetical protein
MLTLTLRPYAAVSPSGSMPISKSLPRAIHLHAPVGADPRRGFASRQSRGDRH